MKNKETEFLFFLELIKECGIRTAWAMGMTSRTWPEDTERLEGVVGRGAEAGEPAGDAAAYLDHHVGLQPACRGDRGQQTSSTPSNRAQSWSSHHWASSTGVEVPAHGATKEVGEGEHGCLQVHGREGGHHEVEEARTHDRQAIHFRGWNEALLGVQVEVPGEGQVEEEDILHSLRHDWDPRPGQVHSTQPLPFRAAWTDETPRVANPGGSAGAHRCWWRRLR